MGAGKRPPSPITATRAEPPHEGSASRAASIASAAVSCMSGIMPPRGYVALPRRWVVERTFSWLGQNRRMSKDYERLCASAEAFVYAAMIRLMVRRLARA